MCGRLTVPPRSDIIHHYSISRVGKRAPLISSGDARVPRVPGGRVPIIVWRGERLLTGMHWGFGDVYNARSETVNEKSFWKESYKERRAIMPIRSFYEREWFTDNELLSGAVVWRQNRNELECSLLTTESSGVVSPHHPRMPLLIPDETVNAWLRGEAGVEDITPVEQLSLWERAA